MKTKTLLLGFLLVALPALLMPVSVAAYDFEVDGIFYNINGNEATVTYETMNYNSYTGEVTIPKTVAYDGKTYSVTTIGEYSFYNCTSLTNVTIPNSVTVICWGAFEGCSGLTNINIPNSVTTILNSAFSGCSGLTHINIPYSVTIIGDDVFSNCTGLTSIYIPASVDYIGVSFNGCSNLTSITVSSDNERYDSRDNCNAIIETARNELFQGCKTTVIPNSVTSINWAFADCSELTYIEIPNSVTSINNCAFFNCTGLDNIVIPNSVTIIGEHTFEGCTGLKSINIPNSVTHIRLMAFSGCSGVTSVTIGNSVSYIGDEAFYGLSELSSVVCKATTPPYALEYNFSAGSTSPYEIATLYVPAESIDSYRAHEEWGRFTHIVPFIGAGPGDVNGDGNISIGDVTNLIDMLINGDAPAYYDVDGNGTVSIADITTLIDMLLAQ